MHKFAAVKMSRIQEELRLISQDNSSSADVRHSMKLNEMLGDLATKLECYQVALNSYLNMVCHELPSYLMLKMFLLNCLIVKTKELTIIYVFLCNPWQPFLNLMISTHVSGSTESTAR